MSDAARNDDNEWPRAGGQLVSGLRHVHGPFCSARGCQPTTVIAKDGTWTCTCGYEGRGGAPSLYLHRRENACWTSPVEAPIGEGVDRPEPGDNP